MTQIFSSPRDSGVNSWRHVSPKGRKDNAPVNGGGQIDSPARSNGRFPFLPDSFNLLRKRVFKFSDPSDFQMARRVQWGGHRRDASSPRTASIEVIHEDTGRDQDGFENA